MKKQNSFKRSLIASVVALCLCVSSLIGTTFAWFTDSVTSSGNVIQTGTLDVAMGWSEATADPETATYKDAAEGAIFYNEYWEPGYVEARHIKISNQGTLALKYKLVIVAEGEVSDLSDVIDVYYYDPAEKVAERDELAGAKKIGTLTDVLKNFETTAQGNLKKGEDHTVTIALKMQESAGNEYQNKSIGTSFSIVLVATQLTSEDDSYGNDYDGRAEFPEVNIATEAHDRTNATTLDTKNVDVEIPIGAAEGNYTLEATEPSKATDSDGNVTLTLDITLKKDGAKVTEDGTVYTVSVNIGAGLNLTKVIHDGDEITDYDYDDVTGIITFETTHFSPFSFTSAPGESVTPDNIGEAVEGGGSVQVSDNITLEAPIIVNAGEKLVLDLNGKTLTFVSTEAKASCAINNKGTLIIKNGTVTYEGVGDKSFGYGTNTVNNSGTLVIENANIINTTKEGSSVGVDNSAGAVFTMNGGSIKSEKNAVRLCPFAKAPIAVTINGGTIEGSRAIQIQLPSNKPAEAPEISLAINDGTLNSTTGLAIYSYSSGQSLENVDVTLNGGIYNGDVAFGGGSAKTTTENVSINFAACEFNGDVYRYVTSDTEAYYVPVDTVEELKAAVEAGNIAVLTDDISVNADTAITIANGKTATIDLNGYTLEGTSSKTGNVDMFLVKGTLNVLNGTVELAALNNQGWNAMTTVFDVTAGGVLNIENANIENLGGTDMAFCVHLNNWGEVTLNATGVNFKSTYVGIRAFNSGNDMNNVTLTDCDILTGNSCIWVHNWTADDFGNDADKAALADARLNFSFNNVTVARTNGSKSLIRFGFTNSIYYSDIEMTEVVAGSEAALKWAAENGKNIHILAGTYTFPGNLIKAGTTVACDEGVIFEGTSSLNVNGATVIGATFTSNGTTVTGTVNGTFKNCVFNGYETLRWCYTSAGTTVSFENCVINTSFRGVHFDEMNGDVYFKNCVINGFNAYSGSGKMTFEGCTFGHDKSAYNGLNIYTNTDLIDCTFNYVSGKTNFIDMEGTGKTLTITACEATLDGEAIEVSTMVGGSKLAQNTVVYNNK